MCNLPTYKTETLEQKEYIARVDSAIEVSTGNPINEDLVKKIEDTLDLLYELRGLDTKVLLVRIED